MIGRHGSRYPTTNSSAEALGKKLVKSVTDGNNFTGNLTFLNTWKYKLGTEIMVRQGYKEQVSRSNT